MSYNFGTCPTMSTFVNGWNTSIFIVQSAFSSCMSWPIYQNKLKCIIKSHAFICITKKQYNHSQNAWFHYGFVCPKHQRQTEKYKTWCFIWTLGKNTIITWPLTSMQTLICHTTMSRNAILIYSRSCDPLMFGSSSSGLY